MVFDNYIAFYSRVIISSITSGTFAAAGCFWLVDCFFDFFTLSHPLSAESLEVKITEVGKGYVAWVGEEEKGVAGEETESWILAGSWKGETRGEGVLV